MKMLLSCQNADIAICPKATRHIINIKRKSSCFPHNGECEFDLPRFRNISQKINALNLVISFLGSPRSQIQYLSQSMVSKLLISTLLPFFCEDMLVLPCRSPLANDAKIIANLLGLVFLIIKVYLGQVFRLPSTYIPISFYTDF